MTTNFKGLLNIKTMVETEGLYWSSKVTVYNVGRSKNVVFSITGTSRPNY